MYPALKECYCKHFKQLVHYTAFIYPVVWWHPSIESSISSHCIGLLSRVVLCFLWQCERQIFQAVLWERDGSPADNAGSSIWLQPMESSGFSGPGGFWRGDGFLPNRSARAAYRGKLFYIFMFQINANLFISSKNPEGKKRVVVFIKILSRTTFFNIDNKDFFLQHQIRLE